MAEARSREGRRVLVALVTGAAGERIRTWRERFDPDQARRLPPHATLCYQASLEPSALEPQVRHAFDAPVEVRLGSVAQLPNADGTLYVALRRTGALDRARGRLFDGRHVALAGPTSWPWHVTCVRYPRRRDLDVLLRAAEELAFDLPWRVARVAHLELRGGRYEPLATWDVG
ncbi:MAG TPA: 2'-5' RNA ligase family protein [Chloroflexota bacterium]|jgi:hypothetical protein|nr:2'-5' RNA ligase family protein [Chloroflexota bacterium]